MKIKDLRILFQQVKSIEISIGHQVINWCHREPLSKWSMNCGWRFKNSFVKPSLWMRAHVEFLHNFIYFIFVSSHFFFWIADKRISKYKNDAETRQTSFDFMSFLIDTICRQNYLLFQLGFLLQFNLHSTYVHQYNFSLINIQISIAPRLYTYISNTYSGRVPRRASWVRALHGLG